MKNSNHPFVRTSFYKLSLLSFLFLLMGCNGGTSKDKTNKAETAEINKPKDILWNVKAILPDGKSLDIKVFDSGGNPHDIKAIQNSDQDNLLDVKAIIKGVKLPVKILMSKNQFSPVVAITPKGSAYKLRAVTPEGEKLDVIGVARFGNIVVMKAVTKKGKFYGVKAISPTGKLNYIKGVKINFQDREMGLKGHEIYAHVKAMHPSVNEDNFNLPKRNIAKAPYHFNIKPVTWNIKAVTPSGENLDIKAFDAEGNKFDVKAIQDSKQHSFMNIKALAKGVELAVKIVATEEEHAPVKAFGTDGSIYDIKAITKDNVLLDVKGINREGNIVNVKAVNENGDFYGVKAFAPDGKLNAVKGIKIFERKVEMKVQGNPVYAHLKALTP